MTKHWFIEVGAERICTPIYAQFLCLVALVELDGVDYEHGSFWA